MTSARARLMAAQTRFEMRLPRMCLYCAGGWVGFDPSGGVAVCCMQSANLPKTPKTVRGWKVPADSMAVLMMPPNGRCDRYSHIKIDSKKAALLDALGYFEEREDER